MKTLITFKTAKKAKELNFPQERIKKNTHYNDFGILDPLGIQGSMITEHYYACSQSTLQKWLREEKDIDVLIESVGGKRGYYFRLQEVPTGDLIQDSDIYGTYEEALEQGLLESLNLI